MSLVIKVPEVGESITEVTISEWFKQDGDYVEMDEIICELESDKASFELNAEAAGKLTIKAQAGETLEIGAEICIIDTEGVNDTSKSIRQEHTEESKSEQQEQTSPNQLLQLPQLLPCLRAGRLTPPA